MLVLAMAASKGDDAIIAHCRDRQETFASKTLLVDYLKLCPPAGLGHFCRGSERPDSPAAAGVAEFGLAGPVCGHASFPDDCLCGGFL